jgi:4-hydroxy-4-methyl-2-oxoglutarate aldolase
MSERIILSQQDLERLRNLDSCTVSNAIERLDLRLRNEGFIAGTARCRFPSFPPMVGYAVTGRYRTSMPPMVERTACYYERLDWWKYVASMPAPRVMVVQDVDVRPGFGAFIGEVHANIGSALGCVGCVTNGAVRDLPAVNKLGFQMFSGSVSVSHAYAHLIDFGEPVEIGGMRIRPGDLLHGDLNGVLSIPAGPVNDLLDEAGKLIAMEQELVEFCKSPEFSVEALAERLNRATQVCLIRPNVKNMPHPTKS